MDNKDNDSFDHIEDMFFSNIDDMLIRLPDDAQIPNYGSQNLSQDQKPLLSEKDYEELTEFTKKHIKHIDVGRQFNGDKYIKEARARYETASKDMKTAQSFIADQDRFNNFLKGKELDAESKQKFDSLPLKKRIPIERLYTSRDIIKSKLITQYRLQQSSPDADHNQNAVESTVEQMAGLLYKHRQPSESNYAAQVGKNDGYAAQFENNKEKARCYR